LDHDHLVERIAALEAELGRLKAATTRREIFKKLAVAGAGAVAGAAVVAAEPARAIDGVGLLIGAIGDANNTATTRTLLTYAGPAFSTPDGNTNFFQIRDSTVDQVQPDTAGIASFVNTKARTAILGYSQGDGVGVNGVSEQGFGVIAFCRDGVGGHFQGGRANVNLPPFGEPPPVRTDAHLQGELVDDRNGDLWLCVESGSPGIWRKLAGRFSAGQLHLLPSPLRVYDSRATTSDGPLATGAQRTVSLSASGATGTVLPQVPLQPSGALISLTITQTVDSGFLAVFANGAPYLGNSNINWYAENQVVAVTTVTAVDAAQLITVLAGGPAGATTQFVVDVIGYYG
jgi:hypothetical protein